ncbi:MAG: DNA polymerase III subunit delta' [Rhodobacteraceae bacterium]|nr:DNA polymerase III subunit delta' [Paracoccaceae bacterium]
MTETPPEADRASGAPHPRETARLIGQQAAERDFLEACNCGRLHHAWLITGPRGVGKATLAWRIARFLLTTPVAQTDGLPGAPPPPETLDIDETHPVAHHMLALSEPRLFLLRRPWDEKKERLKQEITVDEVRKLKGFFTLSATDGGRRVVIVDAADEMNVNAANALLKLLEEPPENTVMLLVAHQPSRLLPTILSRCRALRCRTLDAPEIAEVLAQAHVDPGGNADALAALAGGSAGAALRLITLDGLALYAEIVAIFAAHADRPRALKLAASMVGRANAERFALCLDLTDLFIARLARTGLSGPLQPEATPGEAALLARLSPSPATARRWATLQQELGQRARHGRAVNLDPAALMLDIVLKIHETAAQLAA